MPHVMKPGTEGSRYFGILLERLRQRNGFSRIALAKRVNISGEYIRVIENGSKVPTLSLAMQLLQAMNEHDGFGWNDQNEIWVYDMALKQRAIFQFTSRIKNRRGTQEQSIKKPLRLVVNIDSDTPFEDLGRALEKFDTKDWTIVSITLELKER